MCPEPRWIDYPAPISPADSFVMAGPIKHCLLRACVQNIHQNRKVWKRITRNDEDYNATLTHDAQNNHRVEWFPYRIVDSPTSIDGAIVLVLRVYGQNTLRILELIVEDRGEVLNVVYDWFTVPQPGDRRGGFPVGADTCEVDRLLFVGNLDDGAIRVVLDLRLGGGYCKNNNIL